MTTLKEGTPNTGVTFIDLFAGCGGLSLGLIQAGWRGLFAIEHSKDAFKTFNRNFLSDDAVYNFDWPEWLPQENHDIEYVLDHYQNELKSYAKNVDLIVGGPPCQGFSSAGKRNSSDPRNKLVDLYLEFVKVINPKIVLIENVKGLASDFSDASGKSEVTNYYNKIISNLKENYYVSDKIIDVSEYGVPQRRKRIFIIAIRRDLEFKDFENPFDLLEANRLEFLKNKGLDISPTTASDALSDLEIRRNGTGASKAEARFNEIKYIRPLTKYQKVMHGDQNGKMHDTRLARHRPDIIERFKKIIELCHSTGRLNTSLSKEAKEQFGIRKAALRVMDPASPAPTITSMPDDLLHYSEPRTLTVRESARIQSFPDWFKFEGKYTTGGERRRSEVPRFTQVANAVPPLMAEALGLTLLKLLVDKEGSSL
ncbi:DNA cytosine methyltransferase [Deinococcus sp. 12RED42]|uniref:DNA cytosine methyltransferase n=1 Tax=Deinococcus sp. 12RED42 TaxID=2745872 RepID=UPI001E5BBB64|nr:DNA cytosine methyltransferase [Deinococcus sp. 12RED42]MCD0164348.1 DNA cytosine methyltransferase [Deinococcus sp. 12RED42]